MSNGLESQHVRRCSGAMRLRNTTGSHEIARNIRFFELTRLHVVCCRFRRSFRRRKTEDSHHMWLTQLHNFHFHRPREPRGALCAAFSNTDAVLIIHTDRRRSKHIYLTQFCAGRGLTKSRVERSFGTTLERAWSDRTSCHEYERKIEK